jgi:hypothetical protein
MDLKKKRNPIRLSKRGIIYISLIIVLNTAGVGYGNWNMDIKSQSVISTGGIDPVFVECEITEESEREENEKAAPEEAFAVIADEAEEEVSYVEISEDKKRMDVYIKGAYPGYSAEIKYIIENQGTIPIQCRMGCGSIDGINVEIEEPEEVIYGFGDSAEGVIRIDLEKELEEKTEEYGEVEFEGEKDGDFVEEAAELEFAIDMLFEQYNAIE